MYLVQDAYIEKLIKDYDLKIVKSPNTSLPLTPLMKFHGDTDCLTEYRQKVGSICYPATVTRPDIAKAASKLTEFLINSRPNHLLAVNHCIRYLYATRFLVIPYSTSGGEKLTVEVKDRKHVFEITVNVSFVNENDRRSVENYTFKLFEGLI